MGVQRLGCYLMWLLWEGELSGGTGGSCLSLEVGYGPPFPCSPPASSTVSLQRGNGQACGSSWAHRKLFGDWVVFPETRLKSLDSVSSVVTTGKHAPRSALFDPWKGSCSLTWVWLLDNLVRPTLCLWGDVEVFQEHQHWGGGGSCVK